MKRKKKKDVILQREQPQTQMYSVTLTLPPEEKALWASAAHTNVFLSQQLNENLLIMVNRGVYMSL